MNARGSLDFSTPIVSGAGKGVLASGKVQACFIQRGYLHAHPDTKPGQRVPDDDPTFSPVIRAFGISLNDHLPDDKRQRLVAYEVRLVGSRGTEAIEEQRAWLCTDWIVRTYAPAWLRKAGLTDEADALLALPEVTSTELAEAASPIITTAKEKAAWDARAAWAAWDARAARAAWDAWDARAAWAARAAWDAWDAWDARDAGSDCVLAIGYAAAKGKPSYDEARAAAEAVLAETTAELEESLFALLEAMFALGERETVPA